MIFKSSTFASLVAPPQLSEPVKGLARHREETKGVFGEIAEWNPALHSSSKASQAFNKAYYHR